MLHRRNAIFIAAAGLSLAAGIRATLAATAETSAPEGWTFSRNDIPAARAMAAGPLRPTPHRLGLSAMQGVVRSADKVYQRVAVDLTLPEGGALTMTLFDAVPATFRPSLVIVGGGEEDAPGGALRPTKSAMGDELDCKPSRLPRIEPGSHRVELDTSTATWSVLVDGEIQMHCAARAIHFRTLDLTPGQYRVNVRNVTLGDPSEPVDWPLGGGGWLLDVVAVVVGLVTAGALGFGLAAAGFRPVASGVATAALLTALPLSLLDLRVLAARYRLLPEVAVSVPALLPITLALLVVAHLPRPQSSPGWARWIRDLIAVAGAVGLAIATAEAGSVTVASLVTLALVIALGVPLLGAAESIRRSLALAAPLSVAAAASPERWVGHLLGLGILIAAAGLTPTIGAARPRRALLFSLASAVLLLGATEAAFRAGPQNGAWTNDPEQAFDVLDAAGTAGQGVRMAATSGDTTSSFARECYAKAVPRSHPAATITVWGGSATAPTDRDDLPFYFPAVVEELWGRQYPRARIQVVNQGVPGWTSNEIKRCVKELADDLSPELAILYLGRNDTVGFAGVQAGGNSGKRNQSFLQPFALLRAVRFALLGVVADGSVSPAPPSVARQNILAIADRVSAHGGNTLLLSEATFPRSVTYRDYHRMLADVAAERDDVEFLDTAALLEQELNASFFIDEVHLSALGHQHLAGLIAQFLTENRALMGLVGDSPTTGNPGPLPPPARQRP